MRFTELKFIMINLKETHNSSTRYQLITKRTSTWKIDGQTLRFSISTDTLVV